LSFADQVAVMHEGRLLQAGAPRALYLQPRNRTIAEFLGEAIVLPASLADGWAQCALGRVAVDDRRREGAAQIMLRPEQVSLAQVSPDDLAKTSGPGEPFGEVVDLEFGGAVCTLSVRLRDDDNPPRPGSNDRAKSSTLLQLRRPSNDLPPLGAILRIAVVGTAHVFDQPDG
jgi:iron(III) transport system ATP-binding protein